MKSKPVNLVAYNTSPSAFNAHPQLLLQKSNSLNKFHQSYGILRRPQSNKMKTTHIIGSAEANIKKKTKFYFETNKNNGEENWSEREKETCGLTMVNEFGWKREKIFIVIERNLKVKQKKKSLENFRYFKLSRMHNT